MLSYLDAPTVVFSSIVLYCFKLHFNVNKYCDFSIITFRTPSQEIKIKKQQALGILFFNIQIVYCNNNSFVNEYVQKYRYAFVVCIII